MKNRQMPIDIWKRFHDYEKLTEKLKSISLEFPNLIRLYSIGKSFEFRNIWMVELHKGPSKPNMPKILIDGSMHGSEIVGTECILHFIETLIFNQSESDIDRILTNCIVYVLPMVNPDGVEAGKQAVSFNAPRKNGNGVDINRNFDWRWPSAGSSISSSWEYRGLSPFSEPESIALRDFIRNRKILLYMNLHAGTDQSPHLVIPSNAPDEGIYERITNSIRNKTKFGRIHGEMMGGAYSWAYWIGMDNLRASGFRPLSFAFEVFTNPSYSADSPDWWRRYIPPAASMSALTIRTDLVFKYLCECSLLMSQRKRIRSSVREIC